MLPLDFLLLLLLPLEPLELELVLEPPSSRPQKVASSFICAIIGTRDENKDGKTMRGQGHAVREMKTDCGKE